MSKQMKAMLTSWMNVFVAAVITALIIALGDGGLSIEDLWYVLLAGAVAVLPVVKNYFDKSDTRYGKGMTE
jgi:hypothetical protein